MLKALSRLDEYEIELLRDKYVSHKKTRANVLTGLSESDIPITDEILSKKMGMNILDYRELRKSIEKKLAKFLDRIIDEEQAKDNSELSDYIVAYGRYYVEKYERDYNEMKITLTSNIKSAKVFDDVNYFDTDEQFNKKRVSEKYPT